MYDVVCLYLPSLQDVVQLLLLLGDEPYMLFVCGQLEERHLVLYILNPVSLPFVYLDLVLP